MTEAFLVALGLERATFQTFADHDGAPYPRIMHGPHRAVKNRLEALNRQGSGVFVMANAGDLQGRRAENVVRISAYFADLDGAPLFDAYPLPPTAIVESSPARYHLYWRVTDAPLESFGHVQKHVAGLLGGDDKVHDLPRVMRLPGYLHAKAEPFQSRMLELDASAVYSHEAFLESFAVPVYTPPTALPPLPAAALAYLGRTGEHKSSNRHKLLERVATAGNGGRNDTLHKMACALANDIAAGTLDADIARAELTEAAHMAGLEDREINSTITSAFRYARGN